MTIIDQDFRRKLPELAIDFFVAFSRFECAMKRSATYAQGDERGVDADWGRLARDLGGTFFAEVKASGIAPTLISEPPKKQMKQTDGTLGWREMGPVANTSDLFVAIRRARNNLFHGGKYLDERDGNYTEISGSERSDNLLRQSVRVLELTLARRPEIAHHFYQLF